MLLLFDKGLLAIGNVREIAILHIKSLWHGYSNYISITDSLHIRPWLRHWRWADTSLFLSAPQSQRDNSFFWWNCDCVAWIPHNWHDHWILWIFRTIQVRPRLRTWTLPKHVLINVSLFQWLLPCSHQFPWPCAHIRIIIQSTVYAKGKINRTNDT